MADSDKRTGAGDGPSLSRRAALKGALVAGGALWATPVIQSVNMASASANAGSPGETCYSVKLDGNGRCDDQVFFCLTPTGARGGCPQHPVVTKGAAGTWILTLPAGCHFVEGFSKCGHTSCTPATKGHNGDEVVVVFHPCPKPGGGYRDISVIEFTFCCRVARHSAVSPSAVASPTN